MDVGDVLAGRYELVEEVGAGGMGRVVRARDRTLGRDVAVKLLAPHLLGDAAAVDALRTEARLAAAVRHPNVVQVLDAILDDTDQPAIVMEYVDGPSLREAVPDQGMEVERALEVARAVGAGLAAVHAAGLVHRDVTPANVLLDRDVPRLTDFGIARSAAATSTRTIRGSVGYLAPEQASGEAVGPAADVYALACLTTTLLTGQPPFAAERAVAVVHQHLHEPAPDIRERRADVPAPVAAALAAALAKDPQDRPASVAAFVAALGGGSSTAGAPATVGGAGGDTTVVLPPAEATLVLGGAAAAGVAGAAAASATEASPAGVTEVSEPDVTEVSAPDEPVGPVGPAGSGRGLDDGSRRTLTAAAVAVLVLALLAGAVALAGRDASPDTAAAPTASPDTPASTSPAPPSDAPVSEAPPSPEPAPALPPDEAFLAGVQDLRTVLVDLRGDGDLSAERLDELDELAAKSAEKLREGKPNDAAKELRELRKKLAEGVRDEEISASAESIVLEQVLALEQALAAIPRGEGRGEDDDEDDD